MRRIRCCLLAAACAGAACGPAPEPEPGAFRIFKQADVTTLDPAASNDVTSGEVCALIYDGLVRFDDSLRTVPCLAERWDLSPDRRTYTFRLKGDARFSNGRRVTAADVRYSFERVMAPGGRSSRTWLFAPVDGAADFYNEKAERIRGIAVPDTATVRITLTTPNYLFPSFLAMPAAAVVPREEVAKYGRDFARHPVGSGPWKLAEWRANDRLILVPNPHYHGRAPLLSQIVYRIIPEVMTATGEFEVGNLDMMKIPDAEFERWTTDPVRRPYVRSQDKLAVCYVGLNNRKGPLRDVRVRRALNYAVDTDAIILSILKDRGRTALGAVPPLLLGGTDRHDEPYGYNPATAERLLAEAGYPDGFAMEIWQKHNPEAARLLETVQAYLGQVGVKVTLVTRDWASLKQAVNKGEPDAFYLDWYADYPDAENFLYPLFHSTKWGGEGNRARYWNPHVDSLIDAARREPDPVRRVAAYARVNSTVYADAPWIFLYHPKTYVVHQPWVKGFTIPVIFNGSKLLSVSTGE